MGKQISLKDVPRYIGELRADSKTIALVGGHYDILHVGHARFLQRCKEFADVLIVYVLNDEVTANIKGPGRPVVPAFERAELLAALSSVDLSMIVDWPVSSGDKTELDRRLIDFLKPDVYICVLEGDAQSRIKELNTHVKSTRVIGVHRQSLNWSTTRIAGVISQQEHSIADESREPDDYTVAVDRTTSTECIRFLVLSYAAAQRSSCHLRRVGAVLARDGEVLGVGHNRRPERLGSCWCTQQPELISGPWHPACYNVHAEIAALLDAMVLHLDLARSTLFVTSSPCAPCAGILIAAGVSHVVYHQEYTETAGRNLLIQAGIRVQRFVGEL